MPISQIVVLMLENRSFDHLVGFMQSPAFPINGVDGTQENYPDPLGPSGMPVAVTPTAPYVPDLDPGPDHAFPNVTVQLHGANPAPQPSIGSNIGFIADYANVAKVTTPGNVMRCFADGMLPVLGTLAREFAICDNWFSSMPGGTWPNRFFAHCATSGGYIDNTFRDYPMRTIYQNLSDKGKDWRIYFHDIPQSLALANQRQYFRTKYEQYGAAFVRDCQNGQLPRYSFIEPRYFNLLSARANDMHPIHGVVNGELLIAEVYEALRASPQWESTMLIVTWDEHGGFYDHVVPQPATPPDNATQFFDFASYGVRVPAVVVSPLIPKNTIDSTTYDHTSIVATAKVVFDLPAFLTKRDAAANTLEQLCSLPAARATPATLPRPHPGAVALAATPLAPAPTNDLQDDLLALSRQLGLPGAQLMQVRTMARAATEDEAAAEVRAHLAAFEATAPP
ncbi:MAG TPA: alkaline phosphatase family protein [Candidatus Elarobacter sp.]|nr:alkaline phosphatase family protein [Candidatus Elarobacter sp.]